MQFKMLTLLSLGFLLGTQSFAQTSLKYVWVLNEGRYDYVQSKQTIPVSLGRYDVENKSYEEMLEFTDVRFGSDLKVTEDFIFLATDTLLVKLDKYSLTELDRAVVHGIRKIAVDEDQVYITRGEYGVNFNSYFQMRDVNDLSQLTEVNSQDGPKFSTEGVELKDGNVYIAVNNGFDFGNEVGFIGKYELGVSTSYSEIDLGPNGANPDNLMMTDDGIFTLNNKDYSGSSVSVLDFDLNGVATSNLANVGAGCGTSMYYDSRVMYQEFGENKLFGFNPISAEIDDSLELNYEFYGLVADESGQIFATLTDFLSTGSLLVFDANKAKVDSLAIGVSAGNLALDYRSSVGSEELNFVDFGLYPNPTKGNLRLTGNFEIAEVKILNALGSLQYEVQVKSGELIWLDLPQGIYIVEMTAGETTTTEKIIIQ